MAIISKIDGTICKNMLGLSIHVKKYNLTLLEYFEKYENIKQPICKFCKKNKVRLRPKRFINNKPNFSIYCNNKLCIKKYQSKVSSGKKHTQNTKDKIRINRVKYLQNKNRALTGYEKKQKKLFTFGEEWLHNIFVNENFYEKYDIINEFCEFPYFIDFAFINEKVAVEYDGKCHFEHGDKRIEIDIKRDKYLQERGWRVFRIAYFEMKTFKLEDLINFIGDSKEKEFSNQLIKYKEWKEKQNKLNKRKNQFPFSRIKNYKFNQQLVEKIKNSDIDFSKFGWVNHAAKLLNKRPQKVNEWMKRWIPEFYEEKCFKRKVSEVGLEPTV